ncbi:MAG: hypothetical protein DWQ06_16235 [Calditrichaeota bacterium]|nr:MAG: hypothetical protein DWQ06_16235 [Calditrichota bacterium]
MLDTTKIFTNFSFLFTYPETHFDEIIKQVLNELVLVGQSEVVETLNRLHDFFKSPKFSDVEETFTRTFDMNPACCLEVGWHLFGEDYKRGEFLVLMRQSLAEERIPESTELPDHLSHCLQLLAKLEDEDGYEFARVFILPALEKIQHGCKDKVTNPYTQLVDALMVLLKSVYEIKEIPSSSPKHTDPKLNFQESFHLQNTGNGVLNNHSEKML